MRVLHVIPSLSAARGGASKAALDMARALMQRGLTIEIVCSNDDGEGVMDVPLGVVSEFEGLSVRFFDRYSPRLQPIREYAYASGFAAWLQTNIQNYDLIHVHALFSYLPTRAMQIARAKNIPYIAHPIGSLEDWSLGQSALRKRLYLRFFEKMNLRRAAAVHFTAESEATQAMQRISGLRPLVIPLGLTAPRLLSEPRARLCTQYQVSDDDLILLFLGRLHEKKGIEQLIDAMHASALPNLKLIIAGDGDTAYVESLKQRAANKLIPGSYHFTGYVEGVEKQTLLQGADVFALTSYAENFGIAVLEALACATPVLLTPEVPLSIPVERDRLGFVCRPQGGSARSRIDAIQEQLLKITTLRMQLPELGQRGREYAERHHSWPALADQLSAAYEEIISCAPD